MTFLQYVTLAASILGLLSHGAQLYKSLRSRSTKGLSLSTFLLLTITFSLTVLMGIQYRIGPALILTVVSASLTVGVLALLSWRITLAYLGVVAAIILGVLFGPPVIADA